MRLKLLRKQVIIAAFIFSLFNGPATADDTAEANRMFVSAVSLWQSLSGISGDSLEAATQRFALLDEVIIRLNRIVDDYSGSELAVQLMIGADIGPISLTRAQEARSEAARQLAASLAGCLTPTECIRRYMVQYEFS